MGIVVIGWVGWWMRLSCCVVLVPAPGAGGVGRDESKLGLMPSGIPALLKLQVRSKWLTNGKFRLSSDGFEKLDPLYSPEHLRRRESSVKKQLLEKCGKWKA